MYEGERITAQEPRNMYQDGQLVAPSVDGSRPGYYGIKGQKHPKNRASPNIQYEYYKDKDFLKWAKENYPKMVPGKDTRGFRMSDVFKEYENQLVRKNKIFGYNQLVKALGSDNPYSRSSIAGAFSTGKKKITKNMSPVEKSRIRLAKNLLGIIESVAGTPKTMKEVYGPFKYLTEDLKRQSKASGRTGGTKVWELNKSQIKKINKLLNKNFGTIGLQEGTIDNIYNLFKDEKFMKEIRNYDGKTIDPKSHMFKKVFRPGQGGKFPYAYMQLGRILRGEIELDGIKVDKKLGNKIIKSVADVPGKNMYGQMGQAASLWAKFQMAKHFDDKNATYESVTRTVRNAFKDAGIKKLNIDEIFPARTGQLTYGKGSGVYNQFVQFIDAKINQKAKRSFDGRMSRRLNDLTRHYNLAKETGDYSKVEDLLKTHSDDITNTFDNNPQMKGKVNLTQFQWDAKNKKFLSPKQVFESQYKGSYKTIPSKIRTGMEKFYGKTGISIDPGTARTLEKSASDVKALTQGKAWNKAIKSSKAKMLAKTLELAGIKICGGQLAKAGGGRIGFAEPVCGVKYAEQNEDAFMKKAANHKKAADMFKSGKIRPFLMKAKNWAKSNMGPTGWIGGELLVVGLGTAWDMSQGKGWKEAMDNWTGLGGHFGQAEQRLRDIGTEHGWNEEQINDAMKIGQLMDLSTEAEGKQWELEQIQEQQDIGGTARYKSDPGKRFIGEKGYVRGAYQDPRAVRQLKEETPKLWEKGTEIYESLKDYGSSMELYNELQQKKALEEYNKKMKFKQYRDPFDIGYETEESKPFYELEYQKHPLESPTQLWEPYAGGGIVGIRKPNAIAPTGGPMHQGLRSLYNNGRKS